MSDKTKKELLAEIAALKDQNDQLWKINDDSHKELYRLEEEIKAQRSLIQRLSSTVVVQAIKEAGQQ